MPFILSIIISDDKCQNQPANLPIPPNVAIQYIYCDHDYPPLADTASGIIIKIFSRSSNRISQCAIIIRFSLC